MLTLIFTHSPAKVRSLLRAFLPRGETDEFIFNPEADLRLEDGDEVIVLGRPEQVENLRGQMGN